MLVKSTARVELSLVFCRYGLIRDNHLERIHTTGALLLTRQSEHIPMRSDLIQSQQRVNTPAA